MANNEMVYELWVDLEDLQSTISDSRSEISQMDSAHKSKEFASSQDELDAIVEATANATNKILDTAEQIQDIAKSAGVPVHVQKDIVQKITVIFEACTFQDITGQRIQKVVKTMQSVEEKLGKLMTAVKDSGVLADIDNQVKATHEKSGDDKLMSGPQLTGKGRSQDDIDTMF